MSISLHVEKNSSSLRNRLPIKHPAAPAEMRINGRISKFKKSEDVNSITDSLKNYYQPGLPTLILKKRNVLLVPGMRRRYAYGGDRNSR